MKVLVVTNMYPTGKSPAQGTFVASQVDSLRPLVDVKVVHIDRVETGSGVYFGVPVRVRRVTSEWRPDVIHVMNGGALALITIASVGSLPVVISFCGSDLLGDPQRGWKRRAVGQATVWASRAAALRAAAIIAKSRQLASRVPTGVRPCKIHVIPNGVDLNRFRPMNGPECRSSLGWSKDEFHILFSGNPESETKRYRDAVAAAECLRGRDIPARVQLMRGLSHDQVPIWLNAADALLLCSVHEGSPNIVKESLACGCPVVSTDVGDVAERIDGIAGCYLCERNAESMAESLQAVYQRRIRLDCRDKISSMSVAAIAKRVASVYEEVFELRTYTRNQFRSDGRSA
jgi:glycosyltransferase involved in cell wall biosynthesis